MLEVHHSNRLEHLVDGLAELVAVPPTDPFAPETIVVQNQGMARWIGQQLAERTGISANLELPLPATFLWRVVQAWLPDSPDPEAFDKETMLWRLMRILPGHLDEADFRPLKRYLEAEDSDLRLYQLVRRIADLFDQYLVYRTDLLLAWEQGDDRVSEDGGNQRWQARLWRSLCAEAGVHRAELLAELARAMAVGEPQEGILPERVTLFGLTALAPVYLNLLGALARFIPVHVFYLNPSIEYWSDLVDDAGQARRRARALKKGDPDPTGLLDVGNPLLASLGHAGQIFLDQLLEQGGIDHDRFEEPQGKCLLVQVQRDLLYLRDPRTDISKPGGTVSTDDLSIQIHSAHGPLREIQILYDRLLRLFERIEGLEPRDVVVMAPDIDVYAPYVEAVFGAAQSPLRIPWSIADRRVGAGQPLVEALRDLLGLPRGRMEAAETLSLLQVPAVQRRFGLDQAGFERIRTWVSESGVRWGGDAAMRARIGLPAERANTWDFGLDRLFLGYALSPDSDPAPYAEVLPYPDLEGGEVVYLGQLHAFVDALSRWRQRLSERRTLSEWRTDINALLADFFAADEEDEPLMQTVRDRLDAMASLSEGAGFDGKLSLDPVRALLEVALDDSAGAQRFLTGRVSFCNMVPMRSIPFRVVCLVGMNGEAFPRSQRPLSFDLIAAHPRRGDRSRRRDDRYLFLEALLSARDCLYLSWVGNNVRDNSVKVPSVVVSELLDYLAAGYRLADGGDLLERLLVRHPLQPFSRRYFDGQDERLQSRSTAWLEAARTKPEGAIPPFADTALGPPDEALRTLDLEDLLLFLRNTASYFLNRRLGLRLPRADEIPADTEPFDATGLDRYQLRQSLLAQRLAGRDAEEMLARLRGEGILPHGAPGQLVVEEQLEVVAPFVERLGLFAAEPRETLEVELDVGGFPLQGQLRNLTAAGLLDSRLGKLRAKDRLAAWVRHLVLNALSPGGVQPVSRYVAEDCTLTFGPVADPIERLTDLLELRWAGLSIPLAFFPESALAWLEQGRYDSKFNYAWSGEWNPVPEGGDSAVCIAFRGREPIGPEFEANARRILQPVLDAGRVVAAMEELGRVQ